MVATGSMGDAMGSNASMAPTDFGNSLNVPIARSAACKPLFWGG